jgi:DNA-binding NarL/FixJ family response regulator
VLGPDVVVLDISMPGMSGLEVAARLRADDRAPAIVFLTIHDEAEIAAVARALGALAYVVKARLATDLAPAVRAAFGGRPFVSPLR